jgi:adenosylcobalamin-dependent ribonucleoside-triphosphate reductase
LTAEESVQSKNLNIFSFKISDDFVETYKAKKAPFGYRDAAGNSVGEITFLRTYSRKKIDGTKETWVDVCERVINGMYSLQKDHCKKNRLPWNDVKAQASAKEAFDRLFNLKWTPPGRGLWMMGTQIVNVQKNSAALQNCAFVSTSEMTKNNPAKPFAFLMEASMLGVGVGFDDKGADKDFTIYESEKPMVTIIISDDREGWAEATSALINSYLKSDQSPVEFDYSLIRPLGSPIKTFGGTASGPDPLIKLHKSIRKIFTGRNGQKLTRKDIADIGNLIGVCVVSGNVRRSAELLIGRIDDQDFLNLKNSEVFPERNSYDSENPGWGWMSNNSVEVSVGQDLSAIVDGIARNGEPGVIWMDMSRKYGRLADPVNNKDHRVAGFNPCAEQSLESYECCTLVETYLGRHDSLEDYKRTLKFAYLYAKTVTLLPTHWEETNAIMQRNRRIGASMSGVADFADNNGMPVLREWMDDGYKTVQRYDNIYSEWLGVRESIKMTTVKPSGTVSILAGESPGVHWTPGGEYFNRTIRFSNDDPMLPLFRMANYRVEPASESPDTTSVVYFPIKSNAKRSEKDVTIFEKTALAAAAQRYWSDNSVSVTISFNSETEKQHVGTVLHMYDGQLKTVSFLPQGNETYPQMPYTQIEKNEYTDASMNLFPIDFSGVYAGMAADAIGESYCTTDSCEIKLIKENQK